jgi:phage shock protein A
MTRTMRRPECAACDVHEMSGKEVPVAQQSILGRVTTLMRANINALIDGAEDPEKMLDQLLRDFTNNIREAEEAVAMTIGNLRLLEGDLKEANEAADEWGRKAAAASARADELRVEGKTTEADRFDELAKIALKRQIGREDQAKAFDTQVASQTELVEKLKNGLNVMREKREELVQKRDELVARQKLAAAQVQVQEAVREVSVTDPTGEIARFEEKIRRQEAKSLGMQEVAAASLDSQFASLDEATDDIEIETRLAALKAGKS